MNGSTAAGLINFFLFSDGLVTRAEFRFSKKFSLFGQIFFSISEDMLKFVTQEDV